MIYALCKVKYARIKERWVIFRGTYVVSEGVDSEKEVEGETTGPVRFRHDPRLVLPTFQYHTPEQVDLRGILHCFVYWYIWI